MRGLLVGLLLAVLVLAACNGTPAPTATPVPPTTAPTEAAPVETAGSSGQSILPTDAEVATSEILPPGTVTFREDGDTSENPEASNPANFSFTMLEYYQQGGINGITLRIVLYSDGRLVRDGVESQVSPEEVAQIASMLGEMNFMRMDGTFSLSGLSPDQFSYSLSVDTSFGSRTINSTDGATPDTLYAVYDAIKALGQEPTPAP